MSLEIVPPVIRITGLDGLERFNTSERLFYARAEDQIVGTITTPARDTGTVGTFVHTVGSAHPSATFVRGAMRVSTYGSTGANFLGVPVGVWVNIGGTYVAAYTGDLMHTFYFVNNAGAVQLVEQLGSAERRVAGPGSQILQVGGITFDYRIVCGQFS